jgi:hypothetical protein
MRWHENAQYDFSLVSTYFPVLFIVIRSSLCVTFTYWIASLFSLPQHALLMITVCIVYIDSLMMNFSDFDGACGHLCMCALAVLTQQQESTCSSSEIVLILVCDLLWSACAGVEVICRTTRRANGYQLQKTVACCLFACVRVSLNCDSLSFMQAMCRTWLYNILCSLLLLCSSFLPQHDAVLHPSSVVYICAHIFYVHLYAVIASVTLIVCVHARLVYLHVTHNDNTHKNGNVHKIDHLYTSHDSAHLPTTVTTDYSDLMKTLQAAKRANNIA